MNVPNNNEAEQALIGSILKNNDAFYDIADIVTTDVFYREAHREIYRAILSLINKKQPVDIVTVTTELTLAKCIDVIGGAYYLTQLINSVPTHKNIKNYADIIINDYIKREVIKASSNVTNACLDGGNAHDILSEYQTKINDLSNYTAKNNLVPVKEIISPVMDDISDRIQNKVVPGIPTGFIYIDKIMRLRDGELTILAARPSMGKTALALNIAANVARKGKRVIIFSLEMEKKQLVERLIASEGNIDSDALRGNGFHDHHWKQLSRAVSKISEMGIDIDDTPGQTVMQIKAKSVRSKRKQRFDAVIIDYLGLISGPAGIRERHEQVSENVRQIKNLSRELSVPIICLSQLSRDCEKRADKVPVLSDLRESGEIEQTADIVMFIHREAYYDPSSGNQAQILIAKQRNGATGFTYLNWHKETTRFTDREDQERYQRMAGGKA